MPEATDADQELDSPRNLTTPPDSTDSCALRHISTDHLPSSPVAQSAPPPCAALAEYFVLPLPPIVPEEPMTDNWQRSQWQPRAPGIGQLPTAAPSADEHFS